jgi:DNA-binding CsgD family transcriptional regulator
VRGKPAKLGDPLTPLELEHLWYIVEGYTIKEAAEKLWVTNSAVQFHRYNLYIKLGVRTKKQAAAKAHELGLYVGGTLRAIYKVLICGARDYGNAARMRQEIRRLKKKAVRLNRELVIIEGEAPGADQLSRIIGQQEDVHIAAVAALWNTRHRGAGPQRNSIMLALEPDEVLGFHEDITKSKETADMLKQARKAGVPNRCTS